MFFINWLSSRSDWDYRDYCDHRSRLKRRLRRQVSIGAALVIFVLLGLGLSFTSVRAWAQSTQPTKADRQIQQTELLDQK